MRKNSLIVRLVATSTALTLAACSSGSGSANSSAAGGTLRLEVQKSGLATVLQGVADKVNAYEHEGLTVAVKGVKSGDEAVAVQELVQGRADAAFVSVPAVATLDSTYVSKGQSAPLKVVAATGNVSNIVLSPKIHYTGLDSLHGLTLGLSSLTSGHRVKLDYYLGTQGSSEQKLGLKFVALGSSEMPSALASGQIDGFVHSEPTTTIAITKDNAQLALSMGGAARDAAEEVIAVRADYLKSHGEQVKKLVSALQYATDQFQSMSESEIVDIYASYAGAPKDLMAAVYKQKDHFEPGLLPLQEAADAYWKVGIPAMKAKDEVTDTLAEKDIFDFTYSGR